VRRLRIGRFQLFLIVSAALVAAVVVGSGLIVGDFFERRVLAEEEQQTAEVVLGQARQHLAPGSFREPDLAQTARRFDGFLKGLPRVFRIKAFDPTGRIVWSNETRLIGLRFADNPNLRRALDGHITTVLEKPERPEHVFEREREYIAEAYVPITFPASPQVVGVVETYKDVTGVVRGIGAAKRRIWGIAGAAGLFLYLSLAAVVWKASVSERRAIADLERQNRDLVLLQRFARAALEPSDVATLATHIVRSAVDGLQLQRAAVWRIDSGLAPTCLAACPGDTAALCPPDRLALDSRAPQRLILRDALVIRSLVTRRGTQYLFEGQFAGVASRGEPQGLRTLEVMLDGAAIALANVEGVLAIREAHERLAATLAGIADQVVIVDKDMRIVWMNTAAAAVEEREAGRYCFEAEGVVAEACEHCPAVRTFASGTIERGSRVQKLRNGETRYLDVVSAPLRDLDGEVRQVVEVSRDITELTEMERALKEMNAALLSAQAQLVEKERLAAVGEVTVGLHHAILNPLTGVLGALRVLKEGPVDAEERAGALEAAEAEIRKVERLIRKLPDLRRAGGTPYVGGTTMLDLERSLEDGEAQPDPGGGVR